MAGQIIDGNAVAKKIREEVKSEISKLKGKYKKAPLLAAVQVGENPASAVYIKNQKQSCAEVGIEYVLHQLPADTTEQKLLRFVSELNDDTKTTGIILQMPLPEQISAKKIQMNIAPAKDIEGMNPVNLGMLIYSGEIPATGPCTAMAVIELLKSVTTSFKGKETVVVGHSEIVGKPVTLLLLSSLLESATPTVCHIATKDLAAHTRAAEILIVAVGKAGLIKGDMIKEGAIVIDVGINRVPVLDAQGKPVLNEKGKPKKKTVGDVVYEEAIEKVSYITPVPGGVGPVTTVLLLRNTLQLWKQQLGE